MGRSLVKVSRKKSDNRKNGRRKSGFRRRKQRGGAVTKEVQDEFDKIKALLADTTKLSADIGTESAAAEAAARAASNANNPVLSEDETILNDIENINKNIQSIVSVLKTPPTPAAPATGSEQAIVAYKALLGTEPQVQNTNLFKDLNTVYTNLKPDGTLDTTASTVAAVPSGAPSGAAGAAGQQQQTPAAAVAGVDPKTLPGLTHIAVFVPIETNATGSAYAVKSGDPSPYAYYVSDTGTATTGTSNNTPGLVNVDATNAKKEVECDDVTSWTTHT